MDRQRRAQRGRPVAVSSAVKLKLRSADSPAPELNVFVSVRVGRRESSRRELHSCSEHPVAGCAKCTDERVPVLVVAVPLTKTLASVGTLTHDSGIAGVTCSRHRLSEQGPGAVGGVASAESDRSGRSRTRAPGSSCRGPCYSRSTRTAGRTARRAARRAVVHDVAAARTTASVAAIATAPRTPRAAGVTAPRAPRAVAAVRTVRAVATVAAVAVTPATDE